MDKDKFAVNHPPPSTSWLEMQQFIGELMASGGSTYSQSVRDLSQQEALRAAWESTGSSEAHRLKDIHPTAPAAPLQPRKVHQDKPGPGFGRQPQSESGETSGETRDGGQVQHHTCTCPGCPYSSSSSYPYSPPTLHLLKPRGAPPPRAAAPPSSDHPAPRPPKGAAASLGDPGRGEQDEPSSSTSAQRGDPPPGAAPPPPCPALPRPCLCCPCRLHTCGQLLHRQQGASPDPQHGHAPHHHFHHRCPFTSCLLGHTHHPASAPPPGPLFPCLPCQCALPACCCAQLLRHHHPPGGHAPQRGGEGSTAAAGAHPCMHCPAQFPRPSQLLQHQRSQHASEPAGFLCAECGRAFASHGNLRVHLNVHTGARPYACPDCGKGFSQSGALKIHRRIHTGERPYACPYCGRGFPHLAGVRAHQRTHTGEKPYRCQQCGKCFTQSGALKIHTRIHTGERPFGCAACGRGFSNRAGLRFHQRTVHGAGPGAGAGAAGGTAAGWTGARQGGAAPATPRTGPPGIGGVAGRPVNKPHPQPHPQPHPRPLPQPAGGVSSLSSRAESCGGKGGSGRALMYACEDCGLRFGDAPSRNRHQTLEHYSSEEGGGRGE